MQRDPRLHGLSSEHHHALVLARKLTELFTERRADASAARALGARFEQELEPHFQTEEEVLLPALAAAGESALVERTRRDHSFLRACAAAALNGDCEELGPFAERLREHVRFEERELFPRCEALLSDAVLDEVGRRAPKLP